MSVVLYCPFCGGENLWPEPEPKGAWCCRSCNRAFAVTTLPTPISQD